MVDVAVIIVNYKMRACLEACLTSLFADMVGSNLSTQVVIVDNNSRDGIESWLKMKYPNVSCVVLPENGGFGKAQNVGLRAVEARYYFVLNPDTQFGKGKQIVKRLFDFMEENQMIGMCGPKLIYPDGLLQYSCFRFPRFSHPFVRRTRLGKNNKMGKKMDGHAIMKDFHHEETRPVDWVMGAAMFVRRDAIRNVGVFDERFWMYFEDTDWCRRMWEAGWPVYYVHDIVIQHTHGRGSAKVHGAVRALVKNKLARVHVVSWLKYMWKWRGEHKYYESRT